jgi:hypothetical protein
VKFLDVGTEGLRLFEDPSALQRSCFRELVDVDWCLGVHGRNDGQVVARAGDRPHLRLIQHQRLDIDRRQRVVIDARSCPQRTPANRMRATGHHHRNAPHRNQPG